MGVWCRMGSHRPVPSDRWNDGYYFSCCADCGIDLISRGGKWQPVPKGYRVVWKPRESWQIDWTARMRSETFLQLPESSQRHPDDSRTR